MMMNPEAVELYRRLCAMPHQPGGMIYENEAVALAEVARDRVCVEIGSWRGLSTAMLASTAKFVIAVDPHQGVPDTTSQGRQAPTIEPMRKTLQEAGVAQKVAIIPATSRDAFPMVKWLFSDCGVDVLFIDGSHRKEDVAEDLRLYAPLYWFMGLPRFLVLDDLGYAGVREAFEEWRVGWEALRKVGAPPASIHPSIVPVDLGNTWGIEDPIHNRLHEGAVSKMTFFHVR